MANNTVNTFFMLFKSDTKQARAEIDALDKKTEAFRAKGKQRTAEETKEMKETIRQRKELNDTLKETQNNTEKLIETATQAAAAYVSFRAIKSGLLDAQKMNRELTIQTDLWQQNANDVAAYGAAVKAAGGNAQAALGWYQGIRDQNASVGLQTMDFDKLMDRIHNQVKGLSAANAQLVFGQYGIGDKGQQTLLRKDDSEYYKEIQRQKEITSATASGSEAAQKFGTAVDNLDSAMTNLWTKIGQDVLPTLTNLIDGLTGAANWLSKNQAAADAFFGVMVGGALGLTKVLPRLLLGFLGIETGALAAAAALIPFAAAVAAVLGVALALPTASKRGGAAIAHFINRKLGRGDANGIMPGRQGYTSPGGVSSMDFWMSQGYSREQAAGLVANEQRESAGNPSAIGDGGRARGLFQWHPDRQAAILKATGIDVRSAGRADQLKAAAWELENTGLGAQLRRINNAGDAGAFVSRRYERPANELPEAMTRANMAMQIANSSPFSAQNGTVNQTNSGQTVNVQKMEIHTAAKDPQEILRIAQQAFKNVARESHAQINDAVQY